MHQTITEPTALEGSINSRQTLILYTAAIAELPGVGQRYESFKVEVPLKQSLERSNLRRRHAGWMTQEQRVGIGMLSSMG